MIYSMRNFKIIIILFFLSSSVSIYAQTHFTPVWSTAPFQAMNIYISEAKYNNVDLASGDEIGIFDGTYCVGTKVLTGPIVTGSPLAMIASTDDPTTSAVVDGFAAGHLISFKVWKTSSSTEASSVTPTFSYGGATFVSFGTSIVSLAAAGAPIPAILTLTYPNGGDTFIKGENYTVTWNSQNITGNIQIDLYKANSKVFQLASSASNTGSFSFIPPNNLIDGNDYKIGISAMGGTISDISDNNFTISSQASNLTASPTSLILASTAGSQADIFITSNVMWTVSSDVPWLIVGPTSGGYNYSVRVTATSENTSTGPRSGTVTITGGGITRTVAVTQTETIAANISVFPTNITLGPNSGDASGFGLHSNVSWTASGNVPWFTITPASGTSGESTVMVSPISSNSSESPRSGTVTISGGGISRTVAVSQIGTTTTILTVTPSSLTIGASSGATGQLAIIANAAWHVSIEAAWLSATPTEGANGETTVIITTTSANPLTTTRTAMVVISGGGLSRSIPVTQTGATAPQYSIDLPCNPPIGGITNGGGLYNAGSNVTITAVPHAGYTFVSWTENGVIISTNSSCNITVSGQRTIVANFSPVQNPPLITVSVQSLSDFGSQDVNTYSGSQTYIVAGTNLAENITITAPAGFQVSKLNNSGYGATVTLAQSGGTVVSTIIYARFCPTTAGAQSGNITHKSTGTATKNVSVSGTGSLACTPVKIATQPQSQSVNPGSTATFTVTVSGTGPFSYYWYKNGTLQTSFVNTSSTTNTYTTPVLTSADTGCYYHCYVLNCGNSNRDTTLYAYITINIPPTLSVTPEDQPVGDHAGSTTFSVKNTGTGSMNWSASSNQSWAVISSGSSGTNGGTIKVDYTPNNSLSASRTATITVTAPGALSSPQEVTVTQAAHSTKQLLYVKAGNQSEWTQPGRSGSQSKEILEWKNAGYTVVAQPLDPLVLSSTLLAGYDVLRLNMSQGGYKGFSDAEATAVHSWVNAGGRLFADIVCDSNASIVKPFGVNEVNWGETTGRWVYGGSPLRTTEVKGPFSPSGLLAFECMNIPSLVLGSSLTIAAMYETKPAIVYGQFGSGKVVINFTSGWSHDAPWPNYVYRSDIGQEGNLAYLQNIISYFGATTSVAENKKSIPVKIGLHQNYPNPFNPTTNISFELDLASYVELNIYNLKGDLVRNILSKRLNNGLHQITLDASSMSSGVYFYSLTTETYKATKRMLLIK